MRLQLKMIDTIGGHTKNGMIQNSPWYIQALTDVQSNTWTSSLPGMWQVQGPVELGPYWTSPNTSRNVARDEEAGNGLRGANMNTMTACIKHGPHYPLHSGELLRWDELIPLARQLSDRVALLIDENTEESLEVATMLARAIMVIPMRFSF